MNVLVASIVNQTPEVFEAFLDCMNKQTVEHELLIVADPDAPDLDAICHLAANAGAETIYAASKTPEARYGITEATHEWTIPTFHWLAREKQQLLDIARERNVDALVLVDSDLLLASDTLASMLATKKDVVSAVFWTQWTPGAPPLPQVWLSHPYGFTGNGETPTTFLPKLLRRGLVPVAGLGACTAIQRKVLDRVRFWPLVDGLPSEGMWQGEDRHFCIHAQRNHVELWADAWPEIWHCYRPSDREYITQVCEDLRDAVEDAPSSPASYVSFSIEPLEEPGLSEHMEFVRGPLNALPVVPEIAQAISDMKVGEERFVEVLFPGWHPIREYQNAKKLFRLKLLGSKPPSFATPRLFGSYHGYDPGAALTPLLQGVQFPDGNPHSL